MAMGTQNSLSPHGFGQSKAYFRVAKYKRINDMLFDLYSAKEIRPALTKTPKGFFSGTTLATAKTCQGGSVHVIAGRIPNKQFQHRV